MLVCRQFQNDSDFFNCYGCRLFIWAEFHWHLRPQFFGHNDSFSDSGKVCKPLKSPICTTYLPRLVNVVKERPHQRELCEKPRLFGKAWAVVVLDKWLTSEICLNSCGVTKTALLASFVTTKWPEFLFMEGYGMVVHSDTQCTIAYSQEFNLKIRFSPKFF